MFECRATLGASIGSKVGDRGHRDIATVGGAVIGAVIGGSIGRSMDEADHACVAQALEYAELNQAVAWENTVQHASYTVTPVEVFRSNRGTECRKYLVRSTIEGKPQTRAGRACRQDDGSWRSVNQ